MKTEHFMVSTLDFFRVFFVKNFFPKFELLNSGCGLSASAAYLRVFTVITCHCVELSVSSIKKGDQKRCFLSKNLACTISAMGV